MPLDPDRPRHPQLQPYVGGVDDPAGTPRSQRNADPEIVTCPVCGDPEGFFTEQQTRATWQPCSNVILTLDGADLEIEDYDSFDYGDDVEVVGVSCGRFGSCTEYEDWDHLRTVVLQDRANHASWQRTTKEESEA